MSVPSLSVLFDELIVPRVVVDASLDAMAQLRAAAQRELRASLIEATPAPLWMGLCSAGACSVEELVPLFERENHREALKELVALLDRDALVALASRTDPSSRSERLDRGVLFQSVMRLARMGALDDAIAIALRFPHLAEDSHVMLALCELADRPRAQSLIERAMELAHTQSATAVTKDLCAMLSFVDAPALRDALLALCEQRVVSINPENIDVGENPWGWLALAYARLDRVDEMLRCLDRAADSVRDEQCDPLSDAHFAVECALALDAVERRALRVELAHRAFAAMKRHQRGVWEWLVESVAKIVPALEREARSWLPVDSQPPPAPTEERPPPDPVTEARECAEDVRARWKADTAQAILRAIAPKSGPEPEPIDSGPSPSALDRAMRSARTLYERWMRSEFDRASKGWITTIDGEPLSFDAQSRVLPYLSHDELEALLAHACPDRSKRSNLLYFVAETARGCARRGDLAAMHAHVETIANYSTTPALEFELVSLLPEPMREAELRRVFRDTRIAADLPLRENYRLSGLLTEAGFASDELRAIALDALDAITEPALAMECVGRLLRCGAHPRADDARLIDRARAIAPEWLREAPRIVLTEDMERALCALDVALASAFWVHLANQEPPRVSWALAERAFGREALAQFAAEITGPNAL